MIPYKWPVATAIPQNPVVRRQSAKAMQSFLEDGDEQFRQRRAEIASIRQGLDEIAQDIAKDIAKFRRDAPALILAELRKYAYNPEEPRVPKGDPGPGRWTNEGGSGSPDNYDPREEAPNSDRQYEVADTVTRPVASGVKQDGPISASDIPSNSPNHPAPFLDSSGQPVTDDQGRPLFRPANLPPETYLTAGQASQLGAFISSYKRIEGSEQSEQSLEAEGGLVGIIAMALAPFQQGGNLDAERFEGQYVRDYHAYANIALGIFMAAAGVSIDDALAIADAYAESKSNFHGPKDKVYTHSLEADVQNIKLGYKLYKSGRVSSDQ